MVKKEKEKKEMASVGLKNKKVLLIAFSGGKTSAYMTWWILRIHYKAIWNAELKCHVGTDENGEAIYIIVAFANTSKERPETLDFVRNCDLAFGFNTIWLEAVVPVEWGKGTKYRIINYETAKRNGEVFEDVIRKHGIPNIKNPICTREMKTYPIRKMVKLEFGLMPKEFETAIGYRIDEPKRWNTPKKRAKQKKERQIYFFVDTKPVTKPQVNGWWELQEFNLKLKDHEGNCNKCYKKSFNKLIAIEGVEQKNGCVDNWWDEMEQKYGDYIPLNRRHNKKIRLPMTFYRGNTTAKAIQKDAEQWFKDANGEVAVEVYEQALLNNYNPKQISLCNESCEPF